MTSRVQDGTGGAQAPAGHERGLRTQLWHLGLGCLLLSIARLATGQDLVPRTKSVSELKAFYQQNCVRCHGADGSAKGPDGKSLSGLDFTKAAKGFRTLNSEASEREVQAMVKTIRKGLFFGITMPAWDRQLSQEEATLLVKEVLLRAEPGKAIQPAQTGTR
jgi:mono/diheme cytochrome c family protein